MCICHYFHFTMTDKPLCTLSTKGRSDAVDAQSSAAITSFYSLHSNLPQLFQSPVYNRSCWIPCPLWSSKGHLILVIPFFKAHVICAHPVLGTREIKMNG